ncbi:MAG TPA: amino acid adenylation domain-containing protein, partial [Longimicrobiaceae bacterium]
ELYLGGACLARGYLGRPGPTAERFLPDPLAAEPGARVYRTGDRARWTPRGELEFLGRADDQAKVRGFRVEPGEVEAVLERHPAVARAVAVVREDEPGERRLVGYVVPAEGAAAPAPAELRAWLAERLPEHMVPSALVALDAFPLTPSGKVARRALPAPDGAADGGEYVAPRTPTEETVAAIWAGLLKRGRVGARDSFFELGGHSLLGTRVMSRLRDAFGVEVPLRVLFEAPVLAAFAERVDALRPVVSAPAEGDDLAAERAELLALMMEDAGVSGPGEGAVRPQEPDGDVFEFPLSFAQQRLWFIDQLEPGSAVYNMPFALRVRGAVRVEALERALEMLVERHESLRTVFRRAGDGEPVQVVRPPWAPPVPVEDLRALPAAEREAELRRLATAEAERPFDLAEGPLVRAFLARLDEEEWGMFFTMHHIVSDGWSMAVLVREVSELYGALSEGREPALPDLPVQYADFAVWQRDWLVGETLEAQLAWWRGALAGAPPALELPTDRPRPATASAHAESRSFQLSAGTSRALRALSRGEGATLFMAMLAGFQALLSRWSGQEDVTVGTPIAGRTRSELEELIGFFVNTLVLRADLSGDPSFRALLGRVRENTLGAFQHQDLPFEKLVEELQPERALGHTPLFQVMFSMQNVEDEQLRLGALETEPLELGAAMARFDLSLATYEAGDRLAGGLVFRTDLFDGSTAERLLDHYVRLLDGAAARPDRRLSELDLLAPDERAQLLLAWNATDRAFPAERCVHELVAEQAARTPEAVAVVSRGGRLTYAELEARSDALAGRLRAEGVRPDDRVGLFLERSADAVVGVLGILRAGAAYLALDPGYPDDRLLFMLEDSGARALVTHAALEGRLEAFAGARVDVAGANSLPAPVPAVPVSPRNLAYVIYTSGSTGTPKGVLVEHRGLVNYLSWFDREVLGAEGFDLPLVSRLSFDAHVRQLFPPLLRGEAVWVLPEETVTDPRALLEAISGRERVSFGGVPSLWGAMVELIRSGEAPKPGGLKAVLLGGEALGPELVERTRALYPDAAIWNHYGPTEATVNTTVARVEGSARISIGRPVANVRVYLLDRQGNPVPVGVPGELHVGGVGVTRGYLGRPELTAERFVPDPYSGEIGARMYRSGDRVRWRADGELDYVGRVDFQVKVRGFRIEPGEVETVLERHPEVREAAVVVRGDRLVGYVVAEGSGASVAELRGWLKERLPEYMVPAALVVLERLPLTPNGKVDRRALPEPEESAEDFVAPRTPAEEILAGIYAAVLGVERVGAEDDFFALGGHSLIATRVISRVREAFRVEVPLRALFEAPTVAGMAERVEAALGEGAGTRVPPLVPVPRDGS